MKVHFFLLLILISPSIVQGIEIKKIRGEQQIPWKIKSEEQVQNVSNEFLEKKLGKDFVNQHFEYVEIQRLSDTSIFRVVYHFTSNGYSLDMFLSFDPTGIMFKDYIDWEGSLVIHSPQEINVTEDEAISLASQLIDCQGPFHTRLEVKTVYNYRIVWVVITEEELPVGNTIGVIIDAEDGRVYKKIYNNFMGEAMSERNQSVINGNLLSTKETTSATTT